MSQVLLRISYSDVMFVPYTSSIEARIVVVRLMVLWDNYSSARDTIDTIHHTEIRLVTCVFRTSPVVSILCQAGEPRLHQSHCVLLLVFLGNQITLLIWLILATYLSKCATHDRKPSDHSVSGSAICMRIWGGCYGKSDALCQPFRTLLRPPINVKLCVKVILYRSNTSLSFKKISF